MKNKITFIIPSVNRPTISRSVESLINQTNPNWEALIIYDGVDGQKFDDKRVTTIQITKSGLFGPHNGQSGMVRNYGIEMAESNWIGFLDDDDSLHPNYVETLFKQYYNLDFVVWRMIYGNGIVLPPITSNDLVFGQVGISFCYKNKFKNLLFDNNRNGEDFDFLMKLKNLTSNWVVAPEIYYKVRH